MGGLRYTIAGCLLALVLRIQGRSLPPVAHWGRLAIVGFFMLTLGNGGVVVAEQWISSGLTAVLIATSPFWMVGVDALVTRGPQIFLRQWIGLGVGFAGIVVLVWPDIASGGAGAQTFLGGVIAVQIACAGWAVGSAYTRRHVMPADVLGAAAIQMFAGGAFMLIVGSVLGEWPHLSFTTKTFGTFIYLTLLGSVVAFASYSYALRHLPIAVVSLYTYINPVIAVILGAVLLGEPFSLRMVAAAGIILTGMIVVGKVK